MQSAAQMSALVQSHEQDLSRSESVLRQSKDAAAEIASVQALLTHVRCAMQCVKRSRVAACRSSDPPCRSHRKQSGGLQKLRPPLSVA